jgi:peptide subunit release factor 1 (eRF1)
VTLYLNLTPAKVVREPPVSLTAFNSMRHREVTARQDLVGALSGQQRRRLQADLDEIDDLLDSPSLSQARSVVVFKSGQDLNQVIRLPIRTADSLTIDVDPYVEPLAAALERYPKALIIEVSKDESRFWSQHLGHLEEIEAQRAFTPVEEVRTGAESKMQRHRLTHLHWHMKGTAQRADRLFADQGPDVLVLCGDESVLSELERFLPDRLRVKVEGRLRFSPHRDRKDWQRQIEEVLAGHLRKEEEAALTRLGEYVGHGLLAGGLAGVLEVVNRFLVRRLFVCAGLHAPGFVCRQHHFLSLRPDRCPFCGSELLPVENLADELIEISRMQGIELMVIDERCDLLEPQGGVAAVTYDFS